MLCIGSVFVSINCYLISFRIENDEEKEEEVDEFVTEEEDEDDEFDAEEEDDSKEEINEEKEESKKVKNPQQQQKEAETSQKDQQIIQSKIVQDNGSNILAEKSEEADQQMATNTDPVVFGSGLVQEGVDEDVRQSNSKRSRPGEYIKELATAQGLKTDLVFVKPPGYQYNIG